MKNTILFLILAIGCFACSKKSACFKTKGDIITTEVPIDNEFDSLILYDDLYYTLIPGKESKIILTGGENLLPFIDLELGDNKLTIRNGNKCKFLRSLKNKIFASIYVDSITYLEYYGSRGLTNTETLHGTEFRMFITDGAGEVDLSLNNSYTSAAVTYGVGNFKLSGQTAVAFLSCYGNSYCDTRNFKVTNSISVTSNTQADMLINANNVSLKAVINQKGNIGYKGSPVSKDITQKGEGQLFQVN